MTDKLDAARALIGLTAPIEKTCPAPQRPPPTLLAKELAETPSNTLLTPPSTSTAGGKQRQELKGELLRGKRRPARAIVTARRKKLIEIERFRKILEGVAGTCANGCIKGVLRGKNDDG